MPPTFENGGCKCECYGSGLENIYRKFGAEAVGRTPFVESMLHQLEKHYRMKTHESRNMMS